MYFSAAPQIPYKVGVPRVGDLACVYADPTKAAEELLWKAQFGLEVRTNDFRFRLFFLFSPFFVFFRFFRFFSCFRFKKKFVFN